jgi:outer membrane protein, multidrug efflux system
MMRRGLIGLTAMALAGCMVGPNYERPQTPLPGKYPDEPSANASAAAAAPVRAEWWRLYDDPTLNDLLASALTDNLDVVFAVARIEEADADLREVNASLFPEIDLGHARAPAAVLRHRRRSA